MFVDIQGRKMEVTPALKSYSLEKVSVLNKYLDGNVRVHITMSVGKKFLQRIEVSVSGKGTHLKGSEESNDMYTSIDKVMDKIARQARKFKEKQKDHHANEKISTQDAQAEEFATMQKIIKENAESSRQMSDDEAAVELQLSNKQFIVYRNKEQSGVNVVYYRSDGNIGIVEY